MSPHRLYHDLGFVFGLVVRKRDGSVSSEVTCSLWGEVSASSLSKGSITLTGGWVSSSGSEVSEGARDPGYLNAPIQMSPFHLSRFHSLQNKAIDLSEVA